MSFRKHIVIVVLCFLTACIVLAMVYKDQIIHTLVIGASEREEDQIKNYIGHKVSSDILARHYEGKEARPLKTLLDDYGNSVYFLAEYPDEHLPPGISPAQFLFLVKGGKKDMLKGRSSPRIYRFDEEGKLYDVMVGYSDLVFADWLRSMYGE